MTVRLLAILAFALAVQVGPAFAQLGGAGLPGVNLPSLPQVGQGVEDVSRAANGAGVAVRDLPQTTAAQARSLLGRHRDVLDRDPQGFPIVRGEVLAIAPSAGALAAARVAGFTVVRTDALEGVGDLVTLRAPPGVGAARALERLRSADPQGIYDLDHIHLPSGGGRSAPVVGPAQNGHGRGVRIGLIDGGVGAHASLTGAIAEQRAFSSQTIVPTAHATAIASLLAGRGRVEGAASDAEIYAADIYGGAPTGGSAAALARALTWLAAEHVPVINVSLVGPRNRIVEVVVARMVAQGFVIVAAVGNDGPAAAPLFPASYPGVIGVTGVDLHHHVLIEAGQGPQVVFSALGMPIAASGHGVARMRGTSYAAPIVAGLLAMHVSSPSPLQTTAALAVLRGEARDLGAPGRDDVYGYGLVEPNPQLSRTH